MLVDGPRLGGCGVGEVGDPRTFVPSVWAGLIETFDVKTVIDLGCGLGYATRWFREHGCEAIGLDGSALVAERAVTPIWRHDFAAGPVELYRDYDLCWCSEFAEHVAAEHEDNWLAAVESCRVLALTAAMPGDPGHHHVNCRPPSYWIGRLDAHGFDFQATATDWLRAVAHDAHPYSFFSLTGLVFTRREP